MFKKFMKVTASVSLTIILSVVLIVFILCVTGVYELPIQKKNLVFQENAPDSPDMEAEKDTEADGTLAGVSVQEEIPLQKEEGANGKNSRPLMEDMAIIPEKNISLSFVGDLYFPAYLLDRYDRGGIEALLEKDLLEIMQEADIAAGNEEFPFGTGEKAAYEKEFTFCIPPSRVQIFQDMSLDIVSLANNHVLDFGREVLSETFQTLDSANILYMGAGENLERAKELQLVETGNKKIGYLAASRVLPYAEWTATPSNSGVFSTYDPKNLLEEISTASQVCDLLVVYVHWGIERSESPEAYQRELAKKYIDAGADIVIGSHPHVLQGVEYYNGKPILYSLGNFIFGASTKESVILKLSYTQSGSLKVNLIPCKMQNYQMVRMTEQEGKELFSRLSSLSFQARISDYGEVLPL